MKRARTEGVSKQNKVHSSHCYIGKTVKRTSLFLLHTIYFQYKEKEKSLCQEKREVRPETEMKKG